MVKHPYRRRSAGVSLTDLLVVVVLIPLCCAVLAACVQRSYGGSNRVKCAANLKAIGNSVLLYSNDNKGAYPRTRYAPGATVIPVAGTGAAATNPFAENGPDPNDVSAAIYLLLSTQDITGDSFVCPSSSAEKWDFGGAANSVSNWSNWNGIDEFRKHVSYSYQNPYGDEGAVKSGYALNASVGADFAVFADINPGGDAVVNITLQSSSTELKKANSPNHDREGQNVLYGDGHVDWASTAFAGRGQDNIYSRRKAPAGPVGDGIWASPADLNDNVLLPTAQ